MKGKMLGAVLALSAVLTACEDSATALEASSDGLMVGILELVESDPAPTAGLGTLRAPLTAPDTVQAGVPFTVTVVTFGLDNCWREAGAGIVPELRRITITPYDRVVAGTGGCRQVITQLPRMISLTFTQRGDATLRVEGRRVFNSATANSASVALEKTIYVR